ncbi:MAG: hypothetical protein M3384_10855 [Acidobacteriota bacterium]|nr:hypothetical protein [Acidobacteriota bacterium]
MDSAEHNQKDERYLSLLIPSGIGYLLGIAYLVLISPLPFSPAESFEYIFRKPEVAVWCSLVAAQVAYFAGVTPPLLRKLKEYRAYFFKRKSELLTSGLVLLLLLTLFLLSHQLVKGDLDLPVHYQKIKIFILTFAGLLVLVLALYGMRLVGMAVRDVPLNQQTAYESISKFIRCRDDLSWFLLVSGFIVGGATLTTGALQRALVALNDAKFPYSPSLVLLYGAFGSGVIALIFIPSHLALLDVGKKLCDELLRMPKGNIKELLAWNEERAELEAFLGLKGGTLDTVKTGIAILSPLAGSAISLFIGKG